MNDLENPVALVHGKVAELFPEYRAEVQPSADDEFALCVRVYGVPKFQVGHVEDQVFGLEEALLGNTRYILLPMVKNLEVTRKYYPQCLRGPRSTHRLQDFTR